MKAMILAAAMALSASATAYTVDYGPGAYTKTVKVCGYGRHSSSPGDCKNMTYKFYAPRAETVCNNEGNGSKIRCFKRTSTGNWGARVFSSREEARRWQQCENKGNCPTP